MNYQQILTQLKPLSQNHFWRQITPDFIRANVNPYSVLIEKLHDSQYIVSISISKIIVREAKYNSLKRAQKYAINILIEFIQEDIRHLERESNTKPNTRLFYRDSLVIVNELHRKYSELEQLVHQKKQL